MYIQSTRSSLGVQTTDMNLVKEEPVQYVRRRVAKALPKRVVVSPYFAKKNSAAAAAAAGAAGAAAGEMTKSTVSAKNEEPEPDPEPEPEPDSTEVEDCEAVVTPSLSVEKYRILPADFYACDALDLAPRLLGKLLRREDVVLQITEVEAYREGDTACHARFGRRPRTEAMFRAGGHAYVFLCYGTNVMLNVVAGKDGVGTAVLIRACAPMEGLATILRRRKQKAVKPVLLTGPGKVGQALGLTTDWSCHSLVSPGGLEILDGPAPGAILAGPRVGIDYAKPEDIAAPWRFAIADTAWVSAPRATLLPIQWSPDTILSGVETGV